VADGRIVAMATIEAHGLGKSYGGKPAVADLSFEVRPGSVTGFLGPNGAGKSTTMRLMLGLDNGAGSTTYDGKPFTELRHPMRHVGALLEAKPFHPTRKARNHLRMLAVANGIATSRVDEVLALVGLTDVARAKPKGFSMGMGQRLGLAAALLGEPHTLILDEPANGLDPQGIQWMRLFLKSLAAEGRSIFVSSHLLSEMALMADHLVVIGKGRLIATGPVRDFVSSSRGNAVIVRTPAATTFAELLAREGAQVTSTEPGVLTVAGMTADAVGDLAFDHGVRLHELSRKVATLEEAFLERTAGAEEFQAHAAAEGSAS
jgi:ABC-2 type transport system ATP-binding protein